MAVYKSRAEIPTIDCELVTIETTDTNGESYEFGFDTASTIAVETQTETQDAVRLVVKNKLRAQKPAQTTITGTQITLTDNVFNPELVLVLQGGTINTDPDTGEIIGYQPPTVDSGDTGDTFKLNAYTAQYNAAGVIVNYEKITYPNCKGKPVAFGAEDGAFRAPQYVIDSAPAEGESPYALSYVSALPTLVDTTHRVTQALSNCTSDFTGTMVADGVAFNATISPDDGYTLTGGTVTVTMGSTDISSTAVSGGVITIPAVTGELVITATAVSE